MSKIEKKRNKIQERINEMEAGLRQSLGQKCSDVEIDVPGTITKITNLKKELAELK